MPAASLTPERTWQARYAHMHQAVFKLSLKMAGQKASRGALADDLLPGLFLLLSSRFPALPVLLGGPLPQRLLLRQVRAFQQGDGCRLYGGSASDPVACSSLRSMRQQ